MRVSNFYVFIIGFEYFFFLGLGVYPLLLYFGVIDFPDGYSNYRSFEDLSYLTPFHIILYSIGSFFGVVLFGSLYVKTRFFLRIVDYIYIDPVVVLKVILILSLVPATFFLLKYGIHDVLYTASERRGGRFDYNSDMARFLFMLKFMGISIFAICVYPYFVATKKKVFLSTFIVIFVCVLLYIFTVSRHALFQAFVMTMLVYWSYNYKKLSVNFLASLIGFLAFLILIFGKSLLAYIYGNLVNEQPELYYANFDKILMHFGHLLFSIDAGIRNYLHNGFFIAKDVYLSPLGIIPSRFLDGFGLIDFSYQLQGEENKMSCINTANVGLSGCTIPPYYTGISAYFFPVVGGFLFGFIRFSFYSIISNSWRVIETKQQMNKIPILLMVVVFIDAISTFIPALISLMIFSLVVFFLVRIVSKITLN